VPIPRLPSLARNRHGWATTHEVEVKHPRNKGVLPQVAQASMK